MSCKNNVSNFSQLAEINVSVLSEYEKFLCWMFWEGKSTKLKNIWEKVFKNGPSKICGRQPLKALKEDGLLSRPYSLKIFKGCHPQIFLGPFLNTLSRISQPEKYFKFILLSLLWISYFHLVKEYIQQNIFQSKIIKDMLQ